MDRHRDQQSPLLPIHPQPGSPHSLRLAPDPFLGQRMGSYRLIRLLGSGSSAAIYLGEHILVGNLLYAAIKVPLERFSRQDLEQFCKEASTLCQMVHPHIIRVRDFNVEEGIPFLVMDYAPNGTLRQRHPRGQLVPLGDILSYVKQIASALQYAHEQRFIHRDIKPENLLIGRSGEVLLTDFGIAIEAHRTISQTMQDPKGTFYYMAPEQANGQACPASDQYALGIVVYEWLSGRPPFQGMWNEVLAQHKEAMPAPLRSVEASVPPAVEAVVLRALAKTPKERFPTVEDFAAALEAATQPGRASRADSSGGVQVPVSLALVPAHASAPKPSAVRRSAHWLNLGIGLLVAGVVAIVLAGKPSLSPGSIIGGMLMGVGVVMAWLGARFT